MAIRMVVNMMAAKGKGGEFARLFTGVIPGVLKEPGCEEYHLLRSIDNPDRFVLLERWKDSKSLDDHITLLRSKPSPYGHLREGNPVAERYEVA
ncbi:MAG: antibiotic biosynthesis monooxygenase [Chloroflexi bacterium]|nr:antibiotic biosynthesis monooxygenase [Chloroflexota bacterium]